MFILFKQVDACICCFFLDQVKKSLFDFKTLIRNQGFFYKQWIPLQRKLVIKKFLMKCSHSHVFLFIFLLLVVVLSIVADFIIPLFWLRWEYSINGLSLIAPLIIDLACITSYCVHSPLIGLLHNMRAVYKSIFINGLCENDKMFHNWQFILYFLPFMNKTMFISLLDFHSFYWIWLTKWQLFFQLWIKWLVLLRICKKKLLRLISIEYW